jgi:methylglutaconyl-CoA hydratase
MQSEGKLTDQIKDGVAWICFSHPQSNCLPTSLLKSLINAINKYDQNPSCHTIVLQSQGKIFCAGASIHELTALKNTSDATEFFMVFAKLLLAIKDCRHPVIVRVHGKAVGGAIGLISASDWAIASYDADIRLSDLSVGIGPLTIGSFVIRKIGIGNFQRLSLSTDWQDSNWAATAGLYQEVIKPDESIDEAIKIRIEQFNKLDRMAFLENKKLMWSFGEVTEESLRFKAQTASSLLLNQTTQELLKSLTNKI